MSDTRNLEETLTELFRDMPCDLGFDELIEEEPEKEPEPPVVR